MKLTNPFVILGIAASLVGGAILVVESGKPRLEERSIKVHSTDTTETTVPIIRSDGAEVLAAALSEIRERDRKWNDANALASRTARINLAPVVKDMQEQLRANESMQFPKCLQPGKAYWIESQSETIQSYLEFMGKDDLASAEHMKNSARAQLNHMMVVNACSTP